MNGFDDPCQMPALSYRLRRPGRPAPIRRRGQAHAGTRTWPERCRARQAAARCTRSRSAAESATRTARSSGHPTSAAASCASSASANIPAYYEGILGGQACHQVPAAVRPVRRDHHQRHGRHGHLPPGPGRPRLPVQARADHWPRRPRPALPDHAHRPGAVRARHRAVHDVPAIVRTCSLTLVRNPYFCQWSYAAQPAGYPSRHPVPGSSPSLREQQAEVLAGHADLAHPARLRRPGSGGSVPDPGAHRAEAVDGLTLFLNTRQPPFSSLGAARQAVNYAVDRARILQLSPFRAPGQAAATCQILPPGFPSHQDYCPYTANAVGTVLWHGPDLGRAQAPGPSGPAPRTCR